jgi:hypothetical protein
MSANSVKITVIGVNGTPFQPYQLAIPTIGVKIKGGNASVEGSNSTFQVPNVTGAGGGVVLYQTALTIDQAVALLNEATLSQGALVVRESSVAVNASATVTAANVKVGYFTSTSAAAVTLTLPTATLVAAELGATAGSTYEFVVNNAAGANTVTVAVGSGIVAASALTGGTTLTVAASATVGIGVFRLTFISTTAAILSRTA